MNGKNHPNRNSNPGLPDYEGLPRFNLRSGHLPLKFSAVFYWCANAYHTFVNPQLHANNTNLLVCMLVYRSISNLPVRISQQDALNWGERPCVSRLCTFSPHKINKMFCLRKPLPGVFLSRAQCTWELIQVAIMRPNSLFHLVTNKTFYFVHIAMSYALKCTSNVEVSRTLLRIRGQRFSVRPRSHQPQFIFLAFLVRYLQVNTELVPQNKHKKAHFYIHHNSSLTVA
jgi:hypothetical protein